MLKTNNKQSAFTIVELLVVIVVIGILATITIVSYTSISKQAVIATIKSDLSSASTQLKLFNVENGSYPLTIDCGQLDSSTNKCIKFSPETTYNYTSDSPQSFILDEANGNGNVIYEITDNSEPVSVTPNPLTNVLITGTAEERSVLNVNSISPSDAANIVAYQWQRASDAAFTTPIDISAANSQNYTLTSTDVGKYIRVSVKGTFRFPGNINSNTIGAILANHWIAGQAESGYSTTLVGKYIYYIDATGSPLWKDTDTACASPQCSNTIAPAPDPYGPTKKVLVDPIANPSVVFGTTYPAQQACKVLGGRLPTVDELQAIYVGKVTGRYGTFRSGHYLSATEFDSSHYYTLNMVSNTVAQTYKPTTYLYTRCVK